METTLHHGSWKIATIMGIPVRVHFSWLLVFGLITWSLSTLYFPKAAPQLPELSYWVGGSLAASLLFVSVAFHELSHCLVALKYRLPIANITLFIFGGVSQMKGEPPNPKAELLIAIAGPFSSFILALFFFLISISGFVTHPVARALFSYLTQLNFVLGVFNLIPGFPMDGGRVVRASIWSKTRNFFYATKRASRYGQNIALFFIIFGFLSVFAGFPGALWLMIIGWFLHTAAHASYQQAGIQETLTGIKVKDIMVRDVVAIPSGESVEHVVNDYFLRYGYGGFPVVDRTDFFGFVTLKEIKDIPKEQWRDTRVSQIIIPHQKRWEVSADDDALKALEVMITEDKGRLAVTDKEKMVGLITRNGITGYIQIMGR